VATGEVGAKPFIFVWDAASSPPQVLHEFKGSIKKGISALSFSPNGQKLVAAAIDDDHWMGLFDVSAPGKGSMTHTFKGGREPII
jgi:WD40 repeat protein